MSAGVATLGVLDIPVALLNKIITPDWDRHAAYVLLLRSSLLLLSCAPAVSNFPQSCGPQKKATRAGTQRQCSRVLTQTFKLFCVCAKSPLSRQMGAEDPSFDCFLALLFTGPLFTGPLLAYWQPLNHHSTTGCIQYVISRQLLDHCRLAVLPLVSKEWAAATAQPLDVFSDLRVHLPLRERGLSCLRSADSSISYYYLHAAAIALLFGQVFNFKGSNCL